MTRVTTQVVGTLCGVALALAGASCKKEEAAAPKPVEKPVEKPVAKPPEPVKTLAGAELAKWYQDCWSQFNAKAWPEFKKCFAPEVVSVDVDTAMPPANGPDAVIAVSEMRVKGFPDLVGEPQLILVSGRNVVGAWLLKGTNSGAMPGMDGKEMPPSNKKIGVMLGHVVTVNDTNQVTHEWGFLDEGTFASQLGMSPMPARAAMEKGAASPTVVVAKDDETEKKNLDTVKVMTEAWNKHDAKGVEAVVADDVKWVEYAAPTDQDKKAMMGGLTQLWKGMSDVKITPVNVWAAGDYVVTIATFEGTNDGDIPMMKLKKTGKKVALTFLEIDRFEGGKLKEGHLWYNGMAMATQLGLVPPPGAEKAPAAK